MVFLTKTQVAQRYQVSIRTVSEWMSAGILPYFRIGSVVRFDPLKCDIAMELHEKKSLYGTILEQERQRRIVRKRAEDRNNQPRYVQTELHLGMRTIAGVNMGSTADEVARIKAAGDRLGPAMARWAKVQLANEEAAWRCQPL